MSLSKVCVILGAGASYDVAGDGAPLIDSAYRPPLAQMLFDIKGNPNYWKVIQPYDGAKFLSDGLARLTSSGSISIEQALRELAEHKNDQIRQHFKHIPAYLRDLLFRASTLYTPVPGSYVQLIKRLLADYTYDVLFITLNYDNLLEQALELFNKRFRFGEIANYVASDRDVQVVKLHGSINWFRRLPGGTDVDWDSAIANLDISEKIAEGEILIANGIQVVKNAIVDNHRLYPILTAPLGGKGLDDVVCPESHVSAAKQFLNNCGKFLIIGTSGLDKDLAALLDSTVVPSYSLIRESLKDTSVDGMVSGQ